MANFQTEVETAIACAGVIIYALKKYGYWDKIISKLRIPSTIAAHVAEQGKDTAIAKLQVPDDVMSLLNSYAVDGSGKIVLEKASQVLQDQGRLNTLLKLDRPLTDSEKDEVVGIVKRVMSAYKG